MTDHRAVAEALFAARRDRAPIAPLTDAAPSLTAADGYAIQQELVRLLLGDGGSIVGYKLGLTSKPMQQLIGVDQPDYGPVLSTAIFDDGARIDLGPYIQPKAEAEIAIVLDRPLRGPGVSAMQAAQATRGAVAAIELVDSRIVDWKIKLVDTIADLASSAAVILGDRVVPLDDCDLRLCGMVISRNGATVATGAGAAALGSPVRAVAWLANTLAEFDVTLEPGHFVMTGALHAAFPVEPGDVVLAEFDRLGRLTVTFH
ncbi:MAG: 2-keto-4-pentenoate hydratase [Acidimicrobiales bacterium]